jgi:hypothetical protein
LFIGTGACPALAKEITLDDICLLPLQDSKALILLKGHLFLKHFLA